MRARAAAVVAVAEVAGVEAPKVEEARRAAGGDLVEAAVELVEVAVELVEVAAELVEVAAELVEVAAEAAVEAGATTRASTTARHR